MANKILIVILVLLLASVGTGGYYIFSLHDKIVALDDSLAALEAQELARAATFNQELASLQTDTLDSLNSLEEELKSDLEKTGGQIAGVKADIESKVATEIAAGIETVNNQIGELDERISEVESGMAAAAFDAGQVFEIVNRSTVKISDGENTIGGGFLYDSQGHVVTAFHVVDELSPIYVIMSDGSVSGAEVLGYSQISDVAVLELDNIPFLEPATLGDSSLTKIGEPVAAIGNPLGNPDTLTAGIISQVNRSLSYRDDDIPVPNLFQFDAPVNPGNSGGPLANSKGEVIGIVVARVIASEADGIYYAVTSNKARRVAEAILESGTFDYPWVGVNISDVTPELAVTMSLDAISGVLVTGVSAGSPAALAGFRVDDVIVIMDGVPIRDMGELTSYLGEYKSPGDTLIIEVIRDGSRIEISVIIGSR